MPTSGVPRRLPAASSGPCGDPEKGPDSCPLAGADFHWHGGPDLRSLLVPLTLLEPFAGNPRRGDVAAIAASLAVNGQYRPVVVNRGTHTDRPHEVLAGNHTQAGAAANGWTHLAASYVDVDAQAAARIVLADNRTAELGGYDDAELVALLRSIPTFDGTAWTSGDFDRLIAGLEADRQLVHDVSGPSLADRFLVPPFTTLDARSGPWQRRKREWFDAGIRSETGRPGELAYQGALGRDPGYYTKKRAAEQALGRALTKDEFEADYYTPPSADESMTASGTSVFDPVLCELAVRWYCPPDGLIVDPWAGGSVRGLVSTRLGRRYTGIELRREQVEANEVQAARFHPEDWRGPRPSWLVGDCADRLPELAGTADMLLGCPPYFDLESYGDDPADLSNMSEAEFIEAYGRHLELGYRALRPDRFAFMFLVVGSARDKDGRLRDLRSLTVTLAEAAGFKLHNDGVLLTAVGSASIRVARAFTRTRALGRVHQDLLVFTKGDRRKATQAVGDVVVDDALLDVAFDVTTVGDPDHDDLAPAAPREDPTTADPAELTPVEALPSGMWVKRDDALAVGAERGGKVRACHALVTSAGDVAGLVTAGSRHSPQVAIVASVADQLGLPCAVYVPASKQPPTPELVTAAQLGAEVVEVRPGHNSVIVARAREGAEARGWLEVPFGMEHAPNVAATAGQTENLPPAARRIVIPVGSGMSLAGVLVGMAAAGDTRPVLGVVVGADPTRRLDSWAPSDWRERCELVAAELPYEKPAPVTRLAGIALDPIYEAKCLPFLQPGDLLWIVGRRGSVGA